MLDIKEILDISNEMDVELRDSIDGKHYILNEYGEEIEFNTDMLMKIDEQSTSYKIDLRISMDCNNARFSSNYNLASCENSYVSKRVGINESITDAA